jgi:HTH-type transcriptional regulator/antitoxin HigA
MSRIEKIETEAEYDAALAQIDALMDCQEDTEAETELERLVQLVEAYEDIHYPI